VTFTQVQNGTTQAGTPSGGVTTLTLPLPAASADGTLLIACLVTTAGGVPFKAVANTSPGWEWCGTAVSGVNQQAEIWCYRGNPGGITSAAWTSASSQNCQGHIEEFSTTLRWQVVELFPAAAAGTAGALGPVAMTNPAGSGELAILLTGATFAAAGTGSWSTPAGWTKARSISTTSKNVWASFWKTTTAVGAVSVTGSYSATSGQSAWTEVLVVFRETAAVRSRVGCSLSPATYTDQATINPGHPYPSTKTGSAEEFDYFVGRAMAMTAAVSYQDTPTTASPSHLTSGPTSDMLELWAMGAQMVWAMKANRAKVAAGGTARAAEVAATENDLVLVKQSGITGWLATAWNEMQIDGTKWFPDLPTWMTYYTSLQPVYAAHGIPVYLKPSEASPVLCVSWLPAAGTYSGVLTDYYFDAANGTHNAALDQGFPGGIPSLEAVCDGTVNPDGSTTGCPHPPVPLGIGETGRSGGGSTPAWSEVVAWSASGTWTDSGSAKTANGIRVLFAARLAAGKQNGPILWFSSGNGGANWIHTPGANGENQAGIQAELAAWVDNLAPAVASASGPAVTTTTLPGGAAGSLYSAALAASGGEAPYTWTLNSGALPSGLSLSAAGFITGTPAGTGTATLSVKVTDSDGATAVSGSLSITVTPAVLAITTASLAAATWNVSYPAQVLAAVNGTPPYMWSLADGSAPLPAGMSLSASGVITGTPLVLTAAGLLIGVADSSGHTAAALLTLTVNAPAAQDSGIFVLAGGAWVPPAPESISGAAWQPATEWTISGTGAWA